MPVISPEALELIQKGGMILLLLIAIVWLAVDRNRLLESLRSKDEIIAKKDDQLLSITDRIIPLLTELKMLMTGRRAR